MLNWEWEGRTHKSSYTTQPTSTTTQCHFLQCRQPPHHTHCYCTAAAASPLAHPRTSQWGHSSRRTWPDGTSPQEQQSHSPQSTYIKYTSANRQRNWHNQEDKHYGPTTVCTTQQWNASNCIHTTLTHLPFTSATIAACSMQPRGTHEVLSQEWCIKRLVTSLCAYHLCSHVTYREVEIHHTYHHIINYLAAQGMYPSNV